MDYQTIGKALQIEGQIVHIDKNFLNSQHIQYPDTPSRQTGIELFNQIAQQNDLVPLRDPLGYMALDDNVHQLIHDSYCQHYQQAINKVDAGMMFGGSHGLKSVLTNVNKTARRDVKQFVALPGNYSELRFVKSTPEIREVVDQFAQLRVQLTYSFGIRRSVEANTLDNLKHELATTGQVLSDRIHVAMQSKVTQPKLSSRQLLANSNNDTKSLAVFTNILKQPETITKQQSDAHATATFTTKDRTTAKFLLNNKDYLHDFGFNIVKSNGAITTSWQSARVDKLYEEKQTINLDMSDLNDVETQNQSR